MNQLKAQTKTKRWNPAKSHLGWKTNQHNRNISRNFQEMKQFKGTNQNQKMENLQNHNLGWKTKQINQ